VFCTVQQQVNILSNINIIMAEQSRKRTYRQRVKNMDSLLF